MRSLRNLQSTINMKICSPQLGISPTSKLGGEIYDYQTLKGFTKKGNKVFIYLPKSRTYDKNLKNVYVTYSFLKHVVPPWLFSFLCLPYLFKTYNKEKFDILRIHSPRFLGIAGLIFHVFYPKVPIIASYVTSDESKLFFPIEKKLFQICSKIIVQSQFMKNKLMSIYQVPDKKIAVTYGGQLNLTEKPKKKPKFASLIKKNDRVLLFMGLLIPRKNPMFALEVFLEMRKSFQNLKLIFIGDGSEVQRIKGTTKSLNFSDEVILIKSAFGQEKSYWLSRMDIFLLPSSSEGFGLAVTEAMSFRKPVVVSDIAPFKEIIKDSVDGYTVPLIQSKWVSTIRKLLNDKVLSSKIGENALKKVKDQFNWERTYTLNQKVIESILR